MKKLFQGAEAVISEKDGEIIKERPVKGYRIKEIDDTLRKRRTRAEAKILREAKRCGINVPSVIEETDNIIKMEKIQGEKVRDVLDEALGSLIGSSLAKLHENGIIHGDFTTSNMILSGQDLYIIDFGLSVFSDKDEDKANDIYLLKENLTASHTKITEAVWKAFLKNYKAGYEGSEKAIKVLSRIETRRRYKK
jgi:TP53 regulating kinase and related kinases